MLKPNDVYKKVEDNWVSRFILDEVVIMPLCRSEEDMQYIYSISNETGSRLWQLLDGKHSVRDIQEILKREYQGQAEVIERGVLEFIGDIFAVKLIQKVNGKVKGTKPETGYQKPKKKKAYLRPEIAKVKMQPEQAVLTCCTVGAPTWISKTSGGMNYCQGDGQYGICVGSDCALQGPAYPGWTFASSSEAAS